MISKPTSDSFQFVLPENIAHAFLSLLFLLSGQWVAFLLNAPLVLFNANKHVLSTLYAASVLNGLLHPTEFGIKHICMMLPKSSGRYPRTRRRVSSSLVSTSFHFSIISIGATCSHMFVKQFTDMQAYSE
jgi:hypothetical protein